MTLSENNITTKSEREGAENSYVIDSGVWSNPISSMIASMITFRYRNRYLWRRNVKVSFNDFTKEEDYFYDKRNVIEEIETRNHRESWYDPPLLKSELWNLEEAIEEARKYYLKMSQVILRYTHLNDDEIEGCLDEMIEEIQDWEERKKREMAKREGKLEQYKEQLEIEWENECWQNYLNQRQ